MFKPFSLFIAFLVLLFPAFALEVELGTRNFDVNERMFFNYTLIGGPGYVTYIPSIYCPNGSNNPSAEESVFLNGSHSGVYYGVLVGEDFGPQTCVASIRVPDEDIRVEKEFRIISPPVFRCDLSACVDPSCREIGSFIVGDVAYVDFRCDLVGVRAEAVLQSPWDVSEISLPASFALKEGGLYVVNATFYKDGHIPAKRSWFFSVGKEHARLTDRMICNLNGVCSGGEDHTNCPQDCPGIGTYKNAGSEQPYLSYFVIAFILLLSALLFYAKIKGDRIYKKREEERIAKECAEYVKQAEEQERSKNAGTRPT